MEAVYCIRFSIFLRETIDCSLMLQRLLHTMLLSVAENHLTPHFSDELTMIGWNAFPRK